MQLIQFNIIKSRAGFFFIFLISVDIDNYHDKYQIFISFKFTTRFLLQSESCRNQIVPFIFLKIYIYFSF